MTTISRVLRGLAPHTCQGCLTSVPCPTEGPTKQAQNSHERPEIAFAQAGGPGNLIFSSHHQTLLRPSALQVKALSSCSFLPCWDSAFSKASTHSVLLQVPTLALASPSRPLAHAHANCPRGSASCLPLQFRPFLPLPWLLAPAQSPLTSLLCALSIKGGPSMEESAEFTTAALRLPNIDIPQICRHFPQPVCHKQLHSDHDAELTGNGHPTLDLPQLKTNFTQRRTICK